jgi:hypothetical protein
MISTDRIRPDVKSEQFCNAVKFGNEEEKTMNVHENQQLKPITPEQAAKELAPTVHELVDSLPIEEALEAAGKTFDHAAFDAAVQAGVAAS